MGTHRLGATMIRVLLTACLVGSVISKTCESLPNLSTNQTLDGKDRISSFFSPGHCLAVDAKMNAADLHGNKNAKLYWADCKNVADDSKTPFTLTNKRGKSVQVVVAEFQHFAIKRKNRLQNDFSLTKLKDGYKHDRCITISGFSDISNGVRLQMSRCDKKNAKMRFTGHAAGLWVYRNKKRSNWCLWPPMKTGDTTKVGACISGLLGGRTSLAKINGNWATWTKSGSCSKACGSGKQNFTRTCSNPAPAHGGNACSGSPSKFETCNPQPCAVNGNWTDWSKSGACSQPCGTAPKGKQIYTRTCTAPKPAHGGNNCTGSTEKFEYCNTSIKCPINGNWTDWNKSGNCSQACGTAPSGKQNYTRTCTAPKPAYGGNNCTGSTEKSEYCNTGIKCPVNGRWTEWSNSTSCSGTCGTERQTFIRSCTNPAPAHGGSNCTGSASATDTCNKPLDFVNLNGSPYKLNSICANVCGKTGYFGNGGGRNCKSIVYGTSSLYLARRTIFGYVRIINNNNNNKYLIADVCPHECRCGTIKTP